LKCPNSTTNLATVVAGSAEAPTTDANSAQIVDAHEDSVHTVKVTVTKPHSASSRGSPYLHLDNAQSPKHLTTKTTSQRGAASAYAITRDMKRWTVLPESCAITVDGKEISIS